jgi:hypothetical protein
MFWDINEVSSKLDEVEDYYNWIKTTDSLFTDLKKTAKTILKQHSNI